MNLSVCLLLLFRFQLVAESCGCALADMLSVTLDIGQVAEVKVAELNRVFVLLLALQIWEPIEVFDGLFIIE